MTVNIKDLCAKTFGPVDGDPIMLNYIVAVLEDEEFETGETGEFIFDTLGEIIIQGGFATTGDVARAHCKTLAASLGRPSKTLSTRALDSGPIKLSDRNETLLLDRRDVSHMIQTKFGEDGFSVSSSKDKEKLEKLKQKQDVAQQAAFRAHQERAAKAASSRPSFRRDRPSMGARDVHLENFTISNGGAELVRDANLTLAFGRRYGLIGRNGVGKSTFLRALATHSIPGTPENCSILHVEQEIIGDDTSALDAVLLCDIERAELLEEEKNLEARLANGDVVASDRLAKVHARLIEIDADGQKSRAALILAGLSFDTDMQQRATRTFSGGWRMRIALARALFICPSLLLLDEPTNHLDLHAVIWLENYLLTFPNTVLVVSHARDFLNNVCQEIVHLQSQQFFIYKGNYDQFEQTRANKARALNRQAESADAKRAHVQAFIDKFRFNAKRASLVQSRIKALEKMTTVEVLEEDPDYDFNFPDPGDEVDGNVVGFNDVCFRYNEKSKWLYRDLNFGIDTDSRLAIVGPNGIGKSTLLNLIAGSLAPTTGNVSRNNRVRIAVFGQHHVESLELAYSALQFFIKQFPNVTEQALRSHLASFGVNAELAMQPMYTLSGGQKSRVAFARLTFTKPHILLLDEPTNHLDLDAVEALAKGLTLYKGGVVMVSHDEFFINATVDQLWSCENGHIAPFDGTFTEYKKSLSI